MIQWANPVETYWLMKCKMATALVLFTVQGRLTVYWQKNPIQLAPNGPRERLCPRRSALSTSWIARICRKRPKSRYLYPRVCRACAPWESTDAWKDACLCRFPRHPRQEHVQGQSWVTRRCRASLRSHWWEQSSTRCCNFWFWWIRAWY